MELFHRILGEGEPLYILHGLLGSSDNWMTLGRRFAATYQVVIVDMRNHGRSPKSETWNYEAMAKDIHDLAATLNHKKIRLIGHSMGGKVGMTIADHYPDLLEKLIVADIAPKFYPVRHQRILEGLLSIPLKQIAGRQEADQKLAKYVPQRGLRMFLLKNLEKDPDGGFRWRLNLEVINRHLENVGEATIPDETIEVPTLFIRGINSDYVLDEDIMEIRRYYARSMVESIGNAGHWLHAEQPEAFLQTAMAFLQD